MLWIFATLPLLLLILVSWLMLGLVIVRRVFRLTSGLEVCVLALPVGLVVYLIAANALAYLVSFPVAAWVVTVAALVIGLFFATRPLSPLVWEIPRRTRLILAALLVVLSSVVLYTNAREIFIDDPGHSSMIQLIAAGQFPLRFQCNPAFRASYGYGGDLLSAVVEVVGGTTSWDAQDVVKTASVASVVMLAFLIGWRHKRRVGAGLLSVFLIFTAASMIWLYLPLSTSGGRYLAAQTPGLAALPPALDRMMDSPWTYSVATSGFITPGYADAQRSVSWGFAPFVLLLFLALLDTPMRHRIKSVALGAVMGLTALLHPAALFILAPGVIGYMYLWFVGALIPKKRVRFPKLDFNPILVFGLAFVLIVFQGGPITDSIRDRLDGIVNATTSFFVSSSSTLPSCRGETSTVTCALLSVANMGLPPQLIPVLLWLALFVYKRSSWSIMLIGSIAAILATFILRYGYTDWNIVRLIAFAAWTAAVLLGPILYDQLVQPGIPGKVLAGIAILLISYTGVVETYTLVNGTQAQDAEIKNFSPMVDSLDQMMMPYAAKLPMTARFFDPSGCMAGTSSRPAYLFGRYSVSSASRIDYATGTDLFQKLVADPSADLLYRAGYTHVYYNFDWYVNLTPDAQLALHSDPLQTIAVLGVPDDYRALLRVCAPDEICTPDVPGTAAPFIPTAFTFGNLIQVTGYRQRVFTADHTVHVDFTAMALHPVTDDYRFSLTLTRASDGKVFTVDGALAKSTRDWAVNQPYSRYDVTFRDVPPGPYHLSISWYDADAPDSQDLHPLPVFDAAGKIIAWDAMIVPWLNTPYTQ